MARALIVSVHDVSPRTWQACAEIIAQLTALGVRSVSLLVIPDHHGRGHFRRDPAFCAWLREMSPSGQEIVIHGYEHRRPRRPRETVRQMMTTRFYTAGEGEFYDLEKAAARELVARARGEFAEAGLQPRGFIAPAWLLSEAAETALRELDFDYTTRLATVSDLRTGRVWRSQSLVWSVRSAWRRVVSLAWNAALFRAQAGSALLRISLHPVDLAHDRVWRQIRTLITAALGDREAMTYVAWIERARAADQLSTFNHQPR